MECDIIKRAFDLADSGDCEAVWLIEQRLRREGYSEANEHLAGVHIRSQLRQRIRDARKRSAEPKTLDDLSGSEAPELLR
jgi:hypothetical protein